MSSPIYTFQLRGSFALAIFSFAALTSCANTKYEVTQTPNYDHLIGKRFADAVFKGRQVYKLVRETEQHEELETRRSDGCILVFGVRKKDDIIEFVRIDSGLDTCKVREAPHNL